MGLDMYLESKKSRRGEIIENLADWRKANAIHQWFVDNVQDGEDDCQPYLVSYTKLEELLRRVDIVLKNNKMGKTILPTQEGFFFGTYEYDEYYFEYLNDTKIILEQILKEPRKKDKMYYQSSW
jgi:hypothetical protein